jgi:glyoxylase-like metal-dependent hydrolase (beta-lactamase superfamily II)
MFFDALINVLISGEIENNEVNNIAEENLDPTNEITDYIVEVNPDQDDETPDFIVINGRPISTAETELRLESPYSTSQIINADIEPLKYMVNLHTLTLSYSQVSDISVLSGLTDLTHLDLSYNQISDISLLAGLTNLVYLRLSDNPLITSDKITEIKEALPDTEILYTNSYIMPEISVVTTHKVGTRSLFTNCYFVTNEQTRETIIIDPGDNAAMLTRILEENELKPVSILLTHSHFDHIGAAEQLRIAFDTPVYAWIDEKDLLDGEYYDYYVNFDGNIVANHITWLDDEDTPLEMAGFSIRVIHTTGHTAGGAFYYIESEDALFAGDDWPVNFRRWHSDNALLDSSDGTIVYPGHGDPATNWF